ncbi:hypothetical protein PsYK624_092360 [Phanerochaete sordida]|uniref:DUF6534 domain-containing protein n=1 Tax=Phanerochaete sordida TaxID=48140 RepID=A0A9P3GE37_9APHY|nr:hypothetical protein PsYK624_092360 [Phanerochaete sordida]
MESPVSPPPPLYSVPYQVGAGFILICVMFMLFGTLNAQAYFYAHTYKTDHYALRIFVATVWSLEIFHTVLCLHFFYEYFVLDIGTSEKLLEIPWSVWTSLFVEVTIIAVCQGCYIARLWRFSNRNVFVAGVPSLLVVGHFTTSFVSLWYMATLKTWPAYDMHRPAQILINISVSLSALVDILLVASIIFYLRKHVAGFRSARGVFQTLIFLTVNTGAITVLGSLAILFLLNFMPGSLTYGATLEVMGKLYANAVFGL